LMMNSRCFERGALFHSFSVLRAPRSIRIEAVKRWVADPVGSGCAIEAKATRINMPQACQPLLKGHLIDDPKWTYSFRSSASRLRRCGPFMAGDVQNGTRPPRRIASTQETRALTAFPALHHRRRQAAARPVRWSSKNVVLAPVGCFARNATPREQPAGLPAIHGIVRGCPLLLVGNDRLN
jgi:hypothetical protein